jgi:hypothetical protein
MNGKEFVKIIEKDNEDLFVQSSGRVYEFFSKKPSDEEMSEYFTSRLVNERALCVEAAERVANLPADTSPEEMFLLCKQAMDEAKHFRFVKKAMEHLSGKEVDVAAAIEKIRVRNEKNGTGNPATLIKKYEGTTDKLAYALYQFIAEGRAARNWEALAECAPYDIIRKYYPEIEQSNKSKHFWTHRDKWKTVFCNIKEELLKKDSRWMLSLIEYELSRDYSWYMILKEVYKDSYYTP